MTKFKAGQKVKLLPFEDEPVEYGRVIGPEPIHPSKPSEQLYIVELDEQFCEGPQDDGLREVDESQLEEVT